MMGTGIHAIYRICDLREGRTKIGQVTKRQCFLNFIEVFGIDGLTVIADNTRSETLAFLRRFVTDVHPTRLGNSASFCHALDLALRLNDADAVYLVEDDYLHQAGAARFLLEGLARADYVSLYDHPDKYMEPSPNPLVKNGGEPTRVILTASTHWKFTNSTTMTFAARVATLRADAGILREHCRTPVPRDFFMFMELMKKGRQLVTPIPGRATHCDPFPSPFIFSRAFPIRSDPQDPGSRKRPIPGAETRP